MQKVTFTLVQHPTKEVPGLTTVGLDLWSDPKDEAPSESIVIGEVSTARGSGQFSAVAFVAGERVALGEMFDTRSQAGHKVLKAVTPPKPAKQEGVSRTEAATRLGVSKSTVARRVKSGALTLNDEGNVLVDVVE